MKSSGWADKRISGCLVLVLSAHPLTRLSAQAIHPAPLRTGEATFAMKATKVNDFTGRVVITTASFAGSDLLNVTGSVEVRVDSMRTGIGLRDSHLRGAMQAGRFPTITFQLVGVDPGQARGDTIPLTFQGPLTIHGVPQTIRVPGWVILRPSLTQVYASFPIDMREYGVDPPSRFLGAVKVDPVTQITIRLTFGS